MSEYVYRIDPRDVAKITPFTGKGWMVFTKVGRCSIAEEGCEYPVLVGDATQLMVIADIEIVCSDCAPRPCLFVLQEKGEDDA